MWDSRPVYASLRMYVCVLCASLLLICGGGCVVGSDEMKHYRGLHDFRINLAPQKTREDGRFV